MGMSFRTKLLLLVLITSLLPISGLTAFGLKLLSSQLWRQHEEMVIGRTRLADRLVQAIEQDLHRDAQVLAWKPEIHDALQSEKPGQLVGRLEREFRALRKQWPLILLEVTDRGGPSIGRISSVGASREEGTATLIDGRGIQGMRLVDGTPALTVNAPIAVEGAELGRIILSSRLDALIETRVKPVLGADVALYWNGHPIANTLPAALAQEFATISNRLSEPGGPRSSVVLGGESFTPARLQLTGMGGEPGAVLVFLFPQNLILSAQARIESWATVGLGLAAVFLLGTVLVLSRRLLRPLDELVEGARALGAGRLDIRVWLPRKDEIGALAMSFNEMAGSLERWGHDLESTNSRLQRLLEETEEQRKRLETLTRVARSVTTTLQPKEVFQAIVDAVVTLYPDTACMLWLTEGDALTPQSEAGVFELPTREKSFRVGQGLVGTVAMSREPLIVADVKNDERILNRGWIERQGFVSFFGLPLCVGESVRGVLTLFTRSPHHFLPEEVALLDSFASQAVVAIENARLFQETREKSERLERLRELARTMTGTLDERQVCQFIVDSAVELLGGEEQAIARLWKLDPSGSLLVALEGAGVRRSQGLERATYSPGNGLIGSVVALRQPLTVERIDEDPRIVNRHWVQEEGLVSFAGFPLFLGAELIGVLSVVTRRHHHFTPDEVRFFSNFADQAAIALENARLYAEARRRGRELQGLIRAVRAVTSSLEQGEVLETIAREAALVMGVGCSSLRLHDPQLDRLVWMADVGLPQEWRESTPGRIGVGLAGLVAAGGRPMAVFDPTNDPRVQHPDLWKKYGFASYLGVPVKEGERTIGVLSFYTREPRDFTDDEIGLALSFADQAALAIKNVRLFRDAHRAYEELASTQDRLIQSEKLRALGEMASGVAHDFNNLLAAILGRAELLLRRVTDPELCRWLRVIEQAALDGAQTVCRIQEFTRIRRDQSSSAVDVAELVRDALEVTQPRWQNEPRVKGITLNIEADLSPLPPVPGNAAELREVLTNLILNAIDAMPDGGTLKLSSSADDFGVAVQVKDTGVGIPADDKRRIFEPFYTTKGSRGTGLGLAVAYGITTRHGGEILVESREGVGSTFTVRLPYGPIEGGGGRSRESRVAAGAKILVIDDEELVRDALRDLLSENYVVKGATGGSEGVERVRDESFDLVLTDLGMSDLSGFEVAQLVKTIRPGTPVVLVTGWGVELDPVALRAQGVDGVLSKPFRDDEVHDLIASLVHGRMEKERER